MSVEQKINYQLNKYPKVKKVIKYVYEHAMYAISPKIKSRGDITRISPDDPNHEYFFGYYDKSPWDITDRYMLCLRADDTWSDVSPKEPAYILLIDTSLPDGDKNRVKKLATTHSWNVQQSCMLQWLGPDFSSRILFNDYRDGKYVSVILTLATGEEKVIPAPVYTVSSDGKFALTLDFSRLYNLRPGYGYYNVPEKTKGVSLPDTTAIWTVNLETGEVKSLLKYSDFASFHPRKEMLEDGSVHKVNHLMLSPNGKRFMVLYRWFNGDRKYTRLITCNVDGTDMYVLSDDDMVSHCFWRNDSQILAFENKKKGGPGYYLMKDKTQKYIHRWPELSNDGHPSYSPDRSLIVTDTYPDRTRIQEIKIMNGKDNKDKDVKVIARVFAPFKYDNDIRVDLHPRWNHKGNQICFDGSFEGHRGLYTVKVPGRLNNHKATEKPYVLYISDSLKQRFGVTSVIMNYFRNINHDKVQIDFLVFSDSEKEIVNEIRTAGSKVYFMPKLGMKNVKEFLDYYEKFFNTHRYYKIVHSHFNQIDSLVFPIAKKYGVKYCISHSHNTKYSDYKLRAMRNWVMCIPLKKDSDVWAACGVKAGEFLYGKDFMKSSTHLVIHNAVDIDKYRYNVEVRTQKRKELDLSDEFVIGNVGSFKPQKNQQFLINVFNELLNEVPQKAHYRLMLVGEGALRTELEKKVNELGIKSYVLFTGSRDDVDELLQAMDVYALPSLYEGLPVTGIEAQAAGLPCIFSDTITKEVKICNTKYLSLDDEYAWAREILKLQYFERKDTSDIVHKRGYDIKMEAKKLEDYYRSLV